MAKKTNIPKKTRAAKKAKSTKNTVNTVLRKQTNSKKSKHGGSAKLNIGDIDKELVKSVDAIKLKDDKETTSKSDKLVSKRDKDIDFEQTNVQISKGMYANFQGYTVEEDNGDDKIQVRLLKNARGKVMKESMDIWVEKSNIRELNSYDMLQTINVDNEEEEDKAFIKFEQGTWTCPKCNQLNKNDVGYCDNVNDGKQCGGTKECEKQLTWAGCFTSMSQVCFMCVLLYCLCL